MKKIYRSDTNKVFTGLFGGLGEYLHIDPVILRIIYVGLSLFTAVFPGLLLYIIASIIVPPAPESFMETDNGK